MSPDNDIVGERVLVSERVASSPVASLDTSPFVGLYGDKVASKLGSTHVRVFDGVVVLASVSEK